MDIRKNAQTVIGTLRPELNMQLELITVGFIRIIIPDFILLFYMVLINGVFVVC